MPIHRRIRLDLDRAGNCIGTHVEWWVAGEPHEAVVSTPDPFADVYDALDWALDQKPRQGVLFP